MLEAMAIGVPSVCTDCPAGGAKETIINGNNGLLVPINDEEKFYQAMYKILADKEYAKKLSENAKNIRESHSEEKIFKKWLEWNIVSISIILCLGIIFALNSEPFHMGVCTIFVYESHSMVSDKSNVIRKRNGS